MISDFGVAEKDQTFFLNLILQLNKTNYLSNSAINIIQINYYSYHHCRGCNWIQIPFLDFNVASVTISGVKPSLSFNLYLVSNFTIIVFNSNSANFAPNLTKQYIKVSLNEIFIFSDWIYLPKQHRTPGTNVTRLKAFLLLLTELCLSGIKICGSGKFFGSICMLYKASNILEPAGIVV